MKAWNINLLCTRAAHTNRDMATCYKRRVNPQVARVKVCVCMKVRVCVLVKSAILQYCHT